MGKQITETITRFDGGISSDLYSPERNKMANIQHFDVYRNEIRPFRSTEANETKSQDIVKFAYAADNSGYNLYGFGVSTGAIAQVYEKDGDAITADWDTGVGSAGSGTRSEKVFSEYKNYIYFWQGGTHLARLGPLSGSRNIATYQAISYTDVAEPVLHPADDIMYFFSDNKVHKLDNTTFTNGALTFPTTLKIVSCTAFGNFLAIGCAPVEPGIGESVVYFWDRDSSLTTISAQVFLGKGSLKHIGNVDGTIRCIMDYFRGSSFAVDGAKILAKVIVGDKAITTHELEATSEPASGTFFNNCNKIETGQELLWGMKLVRGDDTISGIWSLDKNGAITCAHVEEDDDGSGIQGFLKLGNYWFIAHSNDGSVNRTDDNANYTFDSIYETLKITGEEEGVRLESKQFSGITVHTKKQPTAGTITVKYRKDEETSYTTIGSSSTDDETIHQFKLDANGSPLPIFKECQLRIESTGGTIISGLEYTYTIVKTSQYGK